MQFLFRICANLCSAPYVNSIWKQTHKPRSCASLKFCPVTQWPRHWRECRARSIAKKWKNTLFCRGPFNLLVNPITIMMYPYSHRYYAKVKFYEFLRKNQGGHLSCLFNSCSKIETCMLFLGIILAFPHVQNLTFCDCAAVTASCSLLEKVLSQGPNSPFASLNIPPPARHSLCTDILFQELAEFWLSNDVSLQSMYW